MATNKTNETEEQKKARLAENEAKRKERRAGRVADFRSVQREGATPADPKFTVNVLESPETDRSLRVKFTWRPNDPVQSVSFFFTDTTPLNDIAPAFFAQIAKDAESYKGVITRIREDSPDESSIVARFLRALESGNVRSGVGTPTEKIETAEVFTARFSNKAESRVVRESRIAEEARVAAIMATLNAIQDPAVRAVVANSMGIALPAAA